MGATKAAKEVLWILRRIHFFGKTCFVVAKALLRLRVQAVVGVGWGAVKRVRENEKSPFPNRNSAMLLALSVAL